MTVLLVMRDLHKLNLVQLDDRWSLILVLNGLFFDGVQEIVDVVTEFVVAAGVSEFVFLALGVFPGFLTALNAFMADPFCSS